MDYALEALSEAFNQVLPRHRMVLLRHVTDHLEETYRLAHRLVLNSLSNGKLKNHVPNPAPPRFNLIDLDSGLSLFKLQKTGPLDATKSLAMRTFSERTNSRGRWLVSLASNHESLALLTSFPQETRNSLQFHHLYGRRMGRYKDYHRESRREDFDSDQGSAAPAFRNRPDHESSQGPEPVEATVKWFNAEKGFGFVELVGGLEAFMHIRQLEAAGHRSVPEGARVKVRIGQGQKGPEVTEIVEVLSGSGAAGRSVGRTRAAPSQVTGQVAESTGTVKVYKTDKGFGFVGQDGGGKDVFVHATALARAGLSGLVEGQRVRMQIGQGQKGLEAQTIELLD